MMPKLSGNGTGLCSRCAGLLQLDRLCYNCRLINIQSSGTLVHLHPNN